MSSVEWKEPAAADLAGVLRAWRRKARITRRSVGMFWRGPEEEEQRLAPLLLACGLDGAAFYSEKERRFYTRGRAVVRLPLMEMEGAAELTEAVAAPFRSPEQEAALLYVFDGADEAGYAALAADLAGARGAALAPFPGSGVLMSSFGGGTAAEVLLPADGALPDGTGQAASGLFLAALILCGAGVAPSFLSAADKLRCCQRNKMV